MTATHNPQIRPNTSAGVHLGTGLQQGGQVGRAHSQHMGTTSSMKGGSNVAGSQSRSFVPYQSIGSTATPTSPKVSFVGPASRVASSRTAARSYIRPADYKPPVPAVKPAAPVDPSPLNYHDAQYAISTGLHGYTGQYNNALKQLDYQHGLDAPHYTNARTDEQTGYDRGRFDLNKSLADHGIFNSGARDSGYGQQDTAHYRAQQQIEDQYGQGALDRYKQAVTQLGTTYAGQMDQAEFDALQRYTAANPAVPAPAAAAAATAGPAAANTTPPQSPGVQRYAPKGWKPGLEGAFLANGKWNWINSTGTIAHGTAAPGPHTRRF